MVGAESGAGTSWWAWLVGTMGATWWVGMTYVYAAVMDRATASTPRFSLVSTKSYRADCGFAAAARCAERKLATNLAVRRWQSQIPTLKLTTLDGLLRNVRHVTGGLENAIAFTCTSGPVRCVCFVVFWRPLGATASADAWALFTCRFD